MSGATAVVAAVPSWNARAATLACLRSLALIGDSSVAVLVVDNGSVDGTPAAVREAHPAAHVIELPENLGFTGAANAALAFARRHGAEYCLLLNDDAVVAVDCIALLVEALEAEPTAGVAGPTILYHDRPQVIWSAGGSIDWRRGSTAMIGMGEIDGGQFGERPRPVPFVTGCAMLLRLAAVARVGGFDPRFFAYYEDAEWCVRATRAGVGVLHVPRARAWHRITPAERAASPLVHYYMTRNRLLFLRRAGASREAWVRTLGLDFARTLLSWSVRPRWRGQRPQLRAMTRALLDFARGRLGRAPLAGA